jgi:ABC-2 type transport system ATP-binding protein
MKIEVKGLVKKFKDMNVLNGINISFNENNIYGLVGLNGSGKSVFLKILCAFYEPTSGEVLFDGKNIIKERSFPPSTRSLIEKPNFISDLTGYENLELLAKIQNKIGKEEIIEALKLVGLENDMNKKYHKYSLGMKQKLGIAQVIMEDPKILILDEPFNGIEEKTAEKLRMYFKKIKIDGKIIIIATHIKEDIDNLADSIYKFEEGNIVLKR